uniref:Uncharacterized protein n=1 Tax=Opuntia streptacantha TaxID=393608 RepID=A0A7C9AHW7_OPUST
MPPQRPAFPVSSFGLMVANMPCVGIGPLSLLWERLSVSKAGELPKFSGMSPVKELLDRSRTAKVGIPASPRGISPESWFPLRFRVTNLSHEEILFGIFPVRRL